MTEGWITRRKLFSTCFQLLAWFQSGCCTSLRAIVGVEQQVVLRVAVAVDATSLCANWPADMHSSLSPPSLNLGIACHAEICPAILLTLLQPYSTQLRKPYRLPTWWYLRLGICVITYHVPFFGKVSVSRQLQNCWARPKIISDVAKFCLTITEDALKFSPSIMPNRLFARQPDCMIAANRHQNQALAHTTHSQNRSRFSHTTYQPLSWTEIPLLWGLASFRLQSLVCCGSYPLV